MITSSDPVASAIAGTPTVVKLDHTSSNGEQNGAERGFFAGRRVRLVLPQDASPFVSSELQNCRFRRIIRALDDASEAAQLFASVFFERFVRFFLTLSLSEVSFAYEFR